MAATYNQAREDHEYLWSIALADADAITWRQIGMARTVTFAAAIRRAAEGEKA